MNLCAMLAQSSEGGKQAKVSKIKKWIGPWGSIRATALTGIVAFWIFAALGALALMWTERFTEFDHFHMDVETIAIANFEEGKEPEFKGETANRAVVRTHSERGLNFDVAMNFSTSALCVTGLSARDFSKFTPEGQMVILFLIQVGGIGVTTLAAFMLSIAARKLLTTDAGIALVDVGLPSGGRPLALLRHVAFYTFVIEGLGVLLLYS